MPKGEEVGAVGYLQPQYRVVRYLCPPTPVLAVAEGPRDTTSVESAAGMQKLEQQCNTDGKLDSCMGVKHVYIWESADAAGEVNAAKLEKNLLSAEHQGN